ncbi:hypothetical protein [Paenibacillus roseipurpureus]|uniref:Uncharacterized protein n=1 Tax=Paenibacillus roseopurpureus TaxID=2918901 RepID=A0AA96LQ21_9BACL|nr:hypothetical protein [Paenibacillus sp. MBLB1832]WNR45222.1 hypothetical protein MJB10_03540 [Paenibacillus sp. MBLB1832]
MIHEHEEKQVVQSEKDITPAPSPVIAWEQSVAHTTESTKSNVISIDSYRRQDPAPLNTEATVTIRDIIASPNENPVRLIIVSSGFGQKLTVPATTIQCKAA